MPDASLNSASADAVTSSGQPHKECPCPTAGL